MYDEAQKISPEDWEIWHNKGELCGSCLAICCGARGVVFPAIALHFCALCPLRVCVCLFFEGGRGGFCCVCRLRRCRLAKSDKNRQKRKLRTSTTHVGEAEKGGKETKLGIRGRSEGWEGELEKEQQRCHTQTHIWSLEIANMGPVPYVPFRVFPDQLSSCVKSYRLQTYRMLAGPFRAGAR